MDKSCGDPWEDEAELWAWDSAQLEAEFGQEGPEADETSDPTPPDAGGLDIEP